MIITPSQDSHQATTSPRHRTFLHIWKKKFESYKTIWKKIFRPHVKASTASETSTQRKNSRHTQWQTHAQSRAVFWKRSTRLREMGNFLAQPWNIMINIWMCEPVLVEISSSDGGDTHKQPNVFISESISGIVFNRSQSLLT